MAQLQQQLSQTQQQGQQDMAQLQQQLAQMQQQGQQEIAQLHGQLDQTQQQLAAAQQPQPWIMQVAQYHKIYAREQRHLVEVPAEETPHIEQWLGKRLDDLAFKVPDLSAFGLTFKGARMLVVNGAPVAQLVYLPADGRAVALCIIHSKKDDKPLTASQQDDLNLVDWRLKGYGFVVLGWETRPAPRHRRGFGEGLRAVAGTLRPRHTHVVIPVRAGFQGDYSVACPGPPLSRG